MRQRIMQGWPFTPEEREQILKYCMSDVDALVRVLPRILSDIDHLGVALYHGEFAAVSAVMEHHGVPIDMEIFQQLADKDVWRAVRDEMVPAIDAQYGVYVRRNNSSDWTFSQRNVDSLSQARGHLRRLAAAGVRRARYAAQNLRGHDKRFSAA